RGGIVRFSKELGVGGESGFEIDGFLGALVNRKHAGVAVMGRVESGVEAHPGRRADGASVGAGETHAFAGESIEMWRPGFQAAVATEHFVAEIVGEDKENVG